MERKYTGIVLDKYDIGETNRIYNIYTLEMGKIKAVAQGIRKPQAKLSGHLENFNVVNVTIARKSGTGRITGAIAENNFSNLKSDLNSLKLAFEAVEVFNKLVGPEEKDEYVYYLLLDFLTELNELSENDNIKKGILFYGFAFKLFETMGYKLEVDKCVSCNSVFSGKSNYFSCKDGGVVCNNCSGKVQNIFRIENDTIKILRIFSKNKLKSLLKLRVNKKSVDDLNPVFCQFLGWIC